MSLGKSSLTLSFVYHFSFFGNCALGITCKYSISSLRKGLISFSMAFSMALSALGTRSSILGKTHFSLAMLFI
jgi:hypothetical protein